MSTDSPAPDPWQDPEFEADPTPPAKVREGYWRRTGGGSLLISIALHAALIMIALLWLIRSSGSGDEEEIPFLPGGGGGGGGGERAAVRRHAVRQASPNVRIASSLSSAGAVSLPDVTSNISPLTSLTAIPLAGGSGTGRGSGRGSGIGSGVGSGTGSGWGPGSGAGFVALGLPKIYASRCSPAERAQKMKANGGGPECEAAVAKALAWLQARQNPDGSWGSTHKGAMTGLALLAYLGHCETPESPQYGETVLKGITYLIDLARNHTDPEYEGIFSTRPRTASSTYEHGIATYALGEMYSFAKLGKREIPGLREAFEKGAAIIIEKQNDAGSWSYEESGGYAINGRNDLSVTGWQFQALKAADHTNLRISGLRRAANRVEKYLVSTQTKDGGFGNTDRSQAYNQWNLTGAALLGLQTIGSGNTGTVNKGVRWLLKELENEPLDWDRNCYLYTWYYNTQAFFQKGGEAWDVWNSQFKPQLLRNQLPDGNWRPENGGPIGAATSSAAGGDADVYRTCMCTLMLEVYYRYLKVGDRDDRTRGLQPTNLRE